MHGENYDDDQCHTKKCFRIKLLVYRAVVFNTVVICDVHVAQNVVRSGALSLDESLKLGG